MGDHLHIKFFLVLVKRVINNGDRTVFNSITLRRKKKKENQIKEALTEHFESVARRRNCTLMNGNLNVKVFLTEKPKQAKIKQKVIKMVKDGKNCRAAFQAVQPTK